MRTRLDDAIDSLTDARDALESYVDESLKVSSWGILENTRRALYDLILLKNLLDK